MPIPNLARGSTGIDLHGVPEGIHPLALHGDSLPVDADLDRTLRDFRFDGFVDWIPSGRRVHGVLAGTFRSNCDRCLVQFDRDIRVDVDVRLLFREEVEAADKDPLDAEIVVRLPSEDPKADLAGPLGASVLLEVPIKNVCREDCRGLCPECGADRNKGECACEPSRGDPRWNALGGLKFPPSEE